MIDRLLTTEEVAEYLRVDVVTVRRLVGRNELIAYKIGGEYRFMRENIEEYVRQQRVSGTEETPSAWIAKMLPKTQAKDRDRSDRFTERARKVLTLANEEAVRLQHNYVGTEHLLLGLVSEGEGIGGKVLSNMGVELEAVRQKVVFIIGIGKQQVTGMVGLTPRSKKVIELGVDEAKRLGHHYIGTEHLLLGLIREGEGVAIGILESLGINLEEIRTCILQIISDGHKTEEEQATSASSPTPPAPQAVPPEASTLLPEGETGLTCPRCGAHSPAYFHYCFNCGINLAQV